MNLNSAVELNRLGFSLENVGERSEPYILLCPPLILLFSCKISGGIGPGTALLNLIQKEVMSMKHSFKELLN